ncbi:MAG TPA: hypothetical protein V6D05_13035 [Stenomitos sp.]
MTRRTLLRLSLGLAVVGPLAGCSVYGFTSALGSLGGQAEVSDVATSRLFNVEGQIRLPLGLTTGRALQDLPALTTVSPLMAVAPTAGVHVYGTAAVRETQSIGFASGTVHEAEIQFVDVVTGEVAATASTTVEGKYAARLSFTGTTHPFVAQTILRNQFNQVVGFLAAPLGVDVSTVAGKKALVDLSPASTMVAFSSVLLTEAYPGFDMRKGFVGIRSKRLAAMVSEISPQRLQKAVTLLDQSRTLSQGTSFDSLLSDTATASAVLTFQVKTLAMQALATDSLTVEAPGLNAALLGQMVDRIAAVTTPPAVDSAQGFFQAIAQQVDLPQAKSDGEQLATTLPELPPLPTPTPADGMNVTFE